MLAITRTVIPRIYTRAQHFVPNSYVFRHRPLLTVQVRQYQRPPNIWAYESPSPPKSRKWLRRSFTVIGSILAIYGLVHLYESTSRLYRHASRFPIYFYRLQRTIAREANMDDLNEALDYFLDIFQLVYNPRLGLHVCDPVVQDILDDLEALPYLIEATGELLELVKEACFEIRSVKWISLKKDEEDIEELEEILHSLDTIFIRHANIFHKYVAQQLARYIEEDEIQVVQLEIEPTNKPSDNDYTSIDG